MKTKVKTIDITAYEWFDRVNGNSYFAGSVTVNYGMKNEASFNMQYQYGYGDYYKQEALTVLKASGLFPGCKGLYELRESGIIIRTVKHENCKQKTLKQF